MSEQKKSVRSPISGKMYALSVHMKYGEVLHIEGVNKEEKDNYMALCKANDGEMILEDRYEVRHLLSQDIAKVSVVPYDKSYERVWHPLKKMVFSESTIRRTTFSALIKAFFLLALVAVVAVLGMKVIDGTILDVFFDGTLFSETLAQVMDYIGLIFKYLFFLMILLGVLDMLLGLRNNFPINQDGSDEIDQPILGNIIIIGIFGIVCLIASGIIGKMLLIL